MNGVGVSVDKQLLISASLAQAYEVKQLLERGADANVKDENEWRPIHFTAYKNYPETLKHLLEHKVDLNTQIKDKQTALHLACANGNIEIIELLLTNGANLNSKDRFNQTPFFKGVDEGHYGVIKYLLDNYEEKIDINMKRDVDGKTALHCAAIKQFVQLIFYLIAHGADIHIPDNDGKVATDYLDQSILHIKPDIEKLYFDVSQLKSNDESSNEENISENEESDDSSDNFTDDEDEEDDNEDNDENDGECHSNNSNNNININSKSNID